MTFQGQGPDWQDFVGIVCLLIINSTISFIEENNAGNAASALMARLAPKTKVCWFNWWKKTFMEKKFNQREGFAWTSNQKGSTFAFGIFLTELISQLANFAGAQRWAMARTWCSSASPRRHY